DFVLEVPEHAVLEAYAPLVDQHDVADHHVIQIELAAPVSKAARRPCLRWRCRCTRPLARVAKNEMHPEFLRRLTSFSLNDVLSTIGTSVIALKLSIKQ